MIRFRLALLAAFALAIGALATVPLSRSAYADATCQHHHTIIDGTGVATIHCDDPVPAGDTTTEEDKTPVSSTGTRPHQPTYAEKVAQIQQQNKAALARYRQQIADRNTRYQNGQCVFKADGQSGPDCGNVTPPKLAKIPKPGKGVKAPPPPPPVTPEEAAYLAISANLKINPSGVGIGPDPALSRWKKAVVGHSYWLWATGPNHLGPISASAAGMSVSLDATISSVTFSMGDGHTVTCDGPGTPYPGDREGLYSKSPTCGYAYQTTSEHQPGGTYRVRVTTYWSVAYTTPTGSGTIPIILASERDLPVGELQTVITR